MIVRVTLKHKRETREIKLDIWGLDSEEVSRILQSDKFKNHRRAILNAYIDQHVRAHIPETHRQNYEYRGDWEFSDHTEQEIDGRISQARAIKRAKEEANKIYCNILAQPASLHSNTA